MTKWPLVKILELKLRQFVEQCGPNCAELPARQFVANRSDLMAQLMLTTIKDECVGSAPGGPHYFVSGVIGTGGAGMFHRRQKHFQIMEELDGKQVCFAVVPFADPHEGFIAARKDARNIVDGLNLATWLRLPETQKALQDL